STKRGSIPSVSASGMFFWTWRLTIARASVNPPRTNADDTTVIGSRAATTTASRSTAISTPSIIVLRSSIVVDDRARDVAGRRAGPVQQSLERHAKPDQRVDPQRGKPVHLRVVLVREVLGAGPEIDPLNEPEALEEPLRRARVYHGVAAVPQIRVVGDGLELLAHPLRVREELQARDGAPRPGGGQSLARLARQQGVRLEVLGIGVGVVEPRREVVQDVDGRGELETLCASLAEVHAFREWRCGGRNDSDQILDLVVEVRQAET